ncbi:MAG: helix-turn-helix domain-containing protein [Solirubrobacterales bacterium]|nr:helix-turn-helix domain-containing protein [Solirubrobacterales bacterium]
MPSGAPQSTPLAIVSSAVAGDGIERVARAASEALGHPVTIILPSLGAPVVWPAEAVEAALLDELVAYAAGGLVNQAPAGVTHALPIRIGNDVVGAVAALSDRCTSAAADDPAWVKADAPTADDPAWLEAAAAAAAVTRLMRHTENGSAHALLETLVAGPPRDVGALVEDGRRLGVDLARGAVAICVHGQAEALEAVVPLVAAVAPRRVVGLAPPPAEREAFALADRLRTAGLEVGVSAPRRQAAALHEAVREAMLLAELSRAPDPHVGGQEETYRLLIGVLLRDRQELELLRASTISPLLGYDAEHDTELLGTLEAFLARHGSTTETAEAMQLHRHTVGYRLSRVQEVSGLSPYESDGRERLSLGLKAAQILAAEQRLWQPG